WYARRMVGRSGRDSSDRPGLLSDRHRESPQDAGAAVAAVSSARELQPVHPDLLAAHGRRRVLHHQRPPAAPHTSPTTVAVTGRHTMHWPAWPVHAQRLAQAI